jgi:sulfite reductase alpha subunit-like flavoprotein
MTALANAIFFFGCRHANKDYIYKEEFENHSKEVPQDKVYVAFSRDQPKKR